MVFALDSDRFQHAPNSEVPGSDPIPGFKYYHLNISGPMHYRNMIVSLNNLFVTPKGRSVGRTRNCSDLQSKFKNQPQQQGWPFWVFAIFIWKFPKIKMEFDIFCLMCVFEVIIVNKLIDFHQLQHFSTPQLLLQFFCQKSSGPWVSLLSSACFFFVRSENPW
jgi:hypothetical protein